MSKRRESPYVWITWVNRLLAGEDYCEWSSWFKANYERNSYKKEPSNFDTAKWHMEHTALLLKTRQKFEADGYEVFIQNQNRIRLQGQTAMLSGIPDLIGLSGSTAVVVDVKTGQPSPSHSTQVLIYMYALEKYDSRFSDFSLEGRVVYSDHDVCIPAGSVTENFISNLGGLMRRLSSDVPAVKVPSEQECAFCPITIEDCQERIGSPRVVDGDENLPATRDF